MSTLKEIREARFLSQRDLAEKAGVSVDTISRIERGLHHPRLCTIRWLAAALDVWPGEIEFQYQAQSTTEHGANEDN